MSYWSLSRWKSSNSLKSYQTTTQFPSQPREICQMMARRRMMKICLLPNRSPLVTSQGFKNSRRQQMYNSAWGLPSSSEQAWHWLAICSPCRKTLEARWEGPCSYYLDSSSDTSTFSGLYLGFRYKAFPRMQVMGWSHMLPMEASLVGNLDLQSAVGLSTITPKLPQRSDRCSASSKALTNHCTYPGVE